MVSWVVQPNSGTGPYVFTAVFKNKNLIDGLNYDLEIAAAFSDTVCPTDFTSAPLQPPFEADVMATNSFTLGAGTAVGLCFGVNARIRNLNSGLIISSLVAYIDDLP